MMNNNPYKIDYIKNTITASKKFLKAASVYGSTEYKTMIQLRTDFPTFTFEEKQISQKKGKQSYKNLTFEKMREHIILCQDGNRLKQFDYLMCSTKPIATATQKSNLGIWNNIKMNTPTLIPTTTTIPLLLLLNSLLLPHSLCPAD